VTYYYNWARLRLYPPSNVMPTVAPGALSSNKLSVSAYATGSTGAPVAPTVASNVPSPALGTSTGEYGMNFGGPQLTVPAGGYISIVITASAASCTVYWGAGQPTDFQVSYTTRSQ